MTDWLTGCGDTNGIRTHVDRTEAQAVAERPVSTEVALTRIPPDPALPTLVVTVKPFVMAASGVTSGTGGTVINPGEQIGPGVSAQLISSLQWVGNIVVIDYDTYQRDPEKIVAGLKNGEQGPFIIKGTVTEFSEMADQTGQGASTGPNIPLMLIPYAGGLASYGYGTKSASETKRTGMVGLDIQIVDPTTGRLVTSFTTEGSFTTISTANARTTWGNTRTKTESVSSAIGQAQRVALNQAITKIHAMISQ